MDSVMQNIVIGFRLFILLYIIFKCIKGFNIRFKLKEEGEKNKKKDISIDENFFKGILIIQEMMLIRINGILLS